MDPSDPCTLGDETLYYISLNEGFVAGVNGDVPTLPSQLAAQFHTGSVGLFLL
jgi:hypothetical protein